MINFPQWRSYEYSDDQGIEEFGVIPLFDEGGREYDPPGPKPFDKEYDERKGTD